MSIDVDVDVDGGTVPPPRASVESGYVIPCRSRSIPALDFDRLSNVRRQETEPLLGFLIQSFLDIAVCHKGIVICSKSPESSKRDFFQSQK